MDIEIVKLKIRRGTDSQRQVVTLEQGELGYTTDTKRVFVGDGATPGGNIIGNIAHPPITVGSRTLLSNATIGDLVYDNNFLYQLSAADYASAKSWSYIGTRVDPDTFSFDAENKLRFQTNSIAASSLKADVIYSQGGLAFNNVEGLSANIDDTTIGITATNLLSVINIGVDEISRASFANGISGGNGDIISIEATENFTYTSGKLELSAVPHAALTNTIDTDDFTLAANKLALKEKFIATGSPLASVSRDANGLVTTLSSSIFDALTANGGDTNAFNGYGNKDNIRNVTVRQTDVNCISGNYDRSVVETIVLSSAGFMTLPQGVSPTGSPQTLDRFAIPIFRY
tara:strand:- start:29 stop:1060 length:1032 start_codon:yes stop_codon:yes gene_type:complete